MRLSFDAQFTPHCLRHTCASRLVQSGVGIRVVQEWLGHKTIQMTMRYAHLSPTSLHEAAAKVVGAAKAHSPNDTLEVPNTLDQWQGHH